MEISVCKGQKKNMSLWLFAAHMQLHMLLESINTLQVSFMCYFICTNLLYQQDQWKCYYCFNRAARVQCSHFKRSYISVEIKIIQVFKIYSCLFKFSISVATILGLLVSDLHFVSANTKKKVIRNWVTGKLWE